MKWLQDSQVPLSPDEEKILLETGRQIFSTEFPNPERKGCPGARVVKNLVYRTESLELRERERWLDHISFCSPCFIEFSTLSNNFHKRKRAKKSIVVAVIMVGLVSWLLFLTTNLFHSPEQPKVVKERSVPEPVAPPKPSPPSTQEQRAAEVQVAVLDLRLRGTPRGGNTGRGGDLELPRANLKLSIYLPFGSEEGNYEVKISGKQNQLARGRGKAAMQNQINVLAVEIDTSSLAPGKHNLSIRQAGWGWSEYAVRLK